MVDGVTWALVNDSMDCACNERLTANFKNLVEIIDHYYSKEA